MALTPEKIDEIAGPADYFDRRVFARAIEAEVRKDDEALIRQMLEAQEPAAYVEVSQSDAEVSMTWGPEPAGFNLPTGRYALYTSPQPAPAAEWQDISTAPKDGRTLLLGYFNSAGNWRTLRGRWVSEDYISAFWKEPENGEPGWYECAVEADNEPNCWATDPTHWMPLPAAPGPADGESNG